MISVLIVEDDSNKLKSIAESICEVEGCDIEGVQQVVDAVSAKRELQKNSFDLLIVDLHIPVRIDQSAQPSGGADLVRSIIDRPIFNLPSHIVAVTGRRDSYEDATKNLNHLVGVIYFDSSANDWREELKANVRIAVSKRCQFKFPTHFDLAIVTALHEELQPILEMGDQWEQFKKEGDPVTYHKTKFHNGDQSLTVVAASAGKMGMAAAACLTSNVISHFSFQAKVYLYGWANWRSPR